MKNNTMVFQLLILNECLSYNSNLGWEQDLQTINNNCFSYLNHDFFTAVELLGIFLVYGSIWFNERDWFSTVLMWWIQLSNHFCFWLSARSSNSKWWVLFILEPWFCHCYKWTSKQCYFTSIFNACNNLKAWFQLMYQH